MADDPKANSHRAQNGRFAVGVRNSPATEFKSGERPSPATEFTKGQVAHNKLPVGSLTFRNRNGGVRAFIKVADPNVWRERAKIVWEETHGEPIPRGLVIHHRDRNMLNDAPDNLQALTRTQHAKEHEYDVKACGFGGPEARSRARAARAKRNV